MTKEEIKAYLSEQITSSMYMEKSELEDERLFSDFGLESTTLVKILTNLHEEYDIAVKPEEFLSHQTLNAASDFLFKKVTVKID